MSELIIRRVWLCVTVYVLTASTLFYIAFCVAYYLSIMSASVRARRPASPPPGLPHAAPQSARFPHAREDHLDADARKAAASTGFIPGRKNHPPGGLKLTSAEWKLIAVI